MSRQIVRIRLRREVRESRSFYVHILIFLCSSFLSGFFIRSYRIRISLTFDIWLIDVTQTGSITPGHFEHGVMPLKEYFTLRWPPEVELHHQMQFSVISRKALFCLTLQQSLQSADEVGEIEERISLKKKKCL